MFTVGDTMRYKESLLEAEAKHRHGNTKICEYA